MSACIHDLLDRERVERPNARALTDTLGHNWSYAELGAAADELADQLSAMGVRADDRVLVVMENCSPAVAAIFAASQIGAAAIPLNARQSVREVDRVIDHAEPAAILFTSAVSSEARTHAERLQAEAMTGRAASLDAVALMSSPDDVLSDVATILYTTGTTGPPKGVMLTHANLLFAAEASGYMRGMTADDVVYGALPISHVFGLASVVIASTHAGALIRLEPRFLPEKLYQALISGVTLLSAVPQMHAHLMQYTKEQGHDRLPTRTLRYVSSGAAPLDPDWKRRAERFYGVPLQNGYGMTEATAGICLTRHQDGNDDISVGRCFPGVEIKLDHDARGAEGDVGEILVGGPGVMKGYFRNVEASDQAFTVDGWLRTGDLGRFDGDGNLHVTGRLKELIIHGGFNVYPPEVEAVLSDHPKVIQCAVIGQKIGGDELVCAFVEASPKDWPDESDLRAFVAERLTGYKRPSRIILMEKLPAAPTGKILKHELLDLLPA